MARKELVISAKLALQSEEFVQGIKAAQDQLNKMQNSSQFNQSQNQLNQRLRQLGMDRTGKDANPDKVMRDARTARDEEKRFLDDKVSRMDKLVRLEAQMTANIEKQRAAKKDQALISELEATRDKVRADRDRAAAAATVAAGGGTPRYTDMGGNVSAAQMGKIMGGGVAALAAAATATERLAGFPMRLEQARGSAVANTTGRDVADIFGGRSAFEAQFMPQREQAGGMAAQKAASNRKTDAMYAAAAVMSLIGGTAVAGTALAAAPFTGGLSMSALGIGGAMIGGGLAGLSNDRVRGQAGGGGKAYDALIAAQQAQDRAQAYQSLKEQDPKKKELLEQYEREHQGYLGTQRALGLTDQGLNTFRSNAANAGFSTSQAQGMSQGILGAGGSARMAREGQYGLQMERSGLTNAPGILGALSGGLGGSETTKSATISIISEAFKIGLDNTQFAEENRRFAESAANIIGRSGATSGTDQDRLSQTLGMFLGERTNKGVEAAGTAYEKYQERGSQLGGRRGAMRFAAARQDKNLSKLGTGELTELLGMNPEDLNENSVEVRTFAKKAGFEGKDAVGQMRDTLGKIQKNTRFMVPSNQRKAQGAQGTIDQYMKSSGLSRAELEDKAQVPGSLPPEVEDAMGNLGITMSMEEQGKLKPREQRANRGELIAETGLPNTAYKPLALGTLGKDTGRIGDQFNQANATGADQARQALSDLTPEIRKAIGAVQDFATVVSGVATTAHSQSNRPDLPRGDAYARDITAPVIGKREQVQGNKPKGNE